MQIQLIRSLIPVDFLSWSFCTTCVNTKSDVNDMWAQHYRKKWEKWNEKERERELELNENQNERTSNLPARLPHICYSHMLYRGFIISQKNVCTLLNGIRTQNTKAHTHHWKERKRERKHTSKHCVQCITYWKCTATKTSWKILGKNLIKTFEARIIRVIFTLFLSQIFKYILHTN